MEMIELDLSLCVTKQDVYELFREPLQLPEWYGCNADALHDLLEERTDRPAIRLTGSPVTEEAAAAARVCRRVLEDCGCAAPDEAREETDEPASRIEDLCRKVLSAIKNAGTDSGSEEA